jgi:hypothetical protein
LYQSFVQLQNTPGDASRKADRAGAFVDAINRLIDERIAAVLPQAHQPARGSKVLPPIPFSDLISARELADKMSLSIQSVRNLESAGKIFSLISAHRKRGREYPGFFAWPGLTSDILRGLEGVPSERKYEFLISPNKLLAGLTPLTVWTGKAGIGGVTSDQSELLCKDQNARQEAVRVAARDVPRVYAVAFKRRSPSRAK